MNGWKRLGSIEIDCEIFLCSYGKFKSAKIRVICKSIWNIQSSASVIIFIKYNKFLFKFYSSNRFYENNSIVYDCHYLYKYLHEYPLVRI